MSVTPIRDATRNTLIPRNEIGRAAVGNVPASLAARATEKLRPAKLAFYERREFMRPTHAALIALEWAANSPSRWSPTSA